MPQWGEIIPGKGKYYPLHPGQQAIINSSKRFIAACAGTGGGKTVIGPLWLARQIQKNWDKGEKSLYMVVAPTYKVLARATTTTLVECFKGTPLEGNWVESRGLYTLPNGGKIWCQGADNPGGLEGGQFDAIWGDEAGQFKFQTWVALQGRTGLNRAPILFTTTPYGRNWLFSDFYEYYKKGDPDYFCQQWASIENPSYPREEYERAKRTMTPEKFAMRYNGAFMQLEGLVYPDIAVCKEDFDISEKIFTATRLGGGIDFGWNDPFAAVSGALDKNDVLHVWYERYKSETTIEEHADALPKFAKKSVIWWSDPSQPEARKKLKMGGHLVKKANNRIMPGIDAVNARIKTQRLKIHPSCRCIFAEGEGYKYPEKDGQIIGDKPVDEDNHAMDALRYMIMGFDGKKAA